MFASALRFGVAEFTGAGFRRFRVYGWEFHGVKAWERLRHAGFDMISSQCSISDRETVIKRLLIWGKVRARMPSRSLTSELSLDAHVWLFSSALSHETGVAGPRDRRESLPAQHSEICATRRFATLSASTGCFMPQILHLEKRRTVFALFHEAKVPERV